MEHFDLLRPTHLFDNYRHQLRQTISAYSPTMTVLGEALQNAIDAIVEIDDGSTHKIEVELDFDERSVRVSDTGVGFSNNPNLLFLGGGTKRSGDRRLFGFVGVGLKVVLFSSMEFSLRANPSEGAFRYEITDAYRFEHDPPPALQMPLLFPQDSSPLEKGTEVYYRFPRDVPHDPIKGFMQNMYDQCLPQGNELGFAKTLKSAVDRGFFENRFAGLMATYLRRYTYAGDVLNCLGGKNELSNTTISVQIACSNPAVEFGERIGALFDGKQNCSFEIVPKYLLSTDCLNWLPSQNRPGLYYESLGRGGTNLVRTWRGFNIQRFADAEDYEKLLTGRNGKFPKTVEESIGEYREKLFPLINGMYLTIGRIPLFDEFLPGASKRVISANGVVTTHEVDLTRGRNQEYVRCFDLVVDVDAQLNYGKAQLTDNHLVNRIRRFVNDAYATTIQTAASSFVGQVTPPSHDEQFDFFLNRDDLQLPRLASKKVPRDENDVIALFFELLGKGYIRGYQSFGLSQMDSYDGRFILTRSGDETAPAVPTDDRQLSAIEFKVLASMLIRDLEREAKDARELKLVIAWDEGSSNSEQYGFADIEHSRFHPNNVYQGVTRYIQNTRSGSQIQVLLLKSVVEDLKEKDEPGPQ